MTWAYGLGKIGKKIYLCEIVKTDMITSPWGYKISWIELLKHPIMVISDLLNQKKYLGVMFQIEKLERNGKKYFTKLMEGEIWKEDV